jgi:hypothetical protein
MGYNYILWEVLSLGESLRKRETKTHCESECERSEREEMREEFERDDIIIIISDAFSRHLN